MLSRPPRGVLTMAKRAGGGGGDDDGAAAEGSRARKARAWGRHRKAKRHEPSRLSLTTNCLPTGLARGTRALLPKQRPAAIWMPTSATKSWRPQAPVGPITAMATVGDGAAAAAAAADVVDARTVTSGQVRRRTACRRSTRKSHMRSRLLADRRSNTRGTKSHTM